MTGPSPLLTANDLRDYLRLGSTSPTEDAVLQELIDTLHPALEAATGELYEEAATYTDSPLNGRGQSVLWLPRPVSVLTAVKIGPVLSAPDETLDVGNPEIVVVDPEMPRRLVRTDGLIFPRGTRNIWLTYTSSAYLPRDARGALLDGCAWAYRRLGSDEALSESVAGYSRQIIPELLKVPRWKEYVDRFSASLV
jgi:hypothetical protein